MTHQVRTTITGTVREDGSGHPRFTVTTTDGTFKTVKDGQVGYGITNSEYQGPVILTVDNGQIVGVSTVDGSSFTGRQS